MSAIFDNASAVTQGAKIGLMSARTLSGKRVSQRRAPFLYKFEVDVNILKTSSAAYKAVKAEIASLDYGVTPLTTAISYLTTENGAWTGTPIVSGASQTGTTVTLSGFNASLTDVVNDGDFIQFANNGKAYQVIGNASSDISGNVSVVLNSPLIVSPVDASLVVHGTSVTFTLALEPTDFSMNYTPRTSTDNLVSPGTFAFTEVIV